LSENIASCVSIGDPARSKEETREEEERKKGTDKKQQSIVESVEFRGAVFFRFSAFFSDSSPPLFVSVAVGEAR
jgi:hypothetical protein